MSPRQNVFRPNYIGVVLVQALHAAEPRLRESVRDANTDTLWTLLTRPLRRHRDERPTRWQ
jgi:hypothetical protein